MNSASWEVVRGVRKARYEGDGWVIDTNKHRLLVWLNGSIEGATMAEIEDRARGRARATLAQFGQRFGLKIDWTGFRKTTESEITMDGPINEVMFEVIKEVAAEAKALGIVAGDSSHKDKVEFKGEGRKVWEGLMYVSNQLPADIRSIGDRVADLERRMGRAEGVIVNLVDSQQRFVEHSMKAWERQKEMHDYDNLRLERMEIILQDIVDITANKPMQRRDT